MRSTTAALMGMVGATLLTTACLQNHDVLAHPPGSGGTTGGGGAGGRARPAGGTGAADGSAGAATPPVEPDGPRTLTLVHGVIDSPWIAFCFTRVNGGVEGPATGALLPSSGLRYGRTVALSALPGVDLAVDGVRPYVVAAAAPEAVLGLDCAAVVALSHAPPLPPVPAPDGALPSSDGSAGPSDASSRDAAPSLVDAMSTVDASPASSAGASSASSDASSRDASRSDGALSDGALSDGALSDGALSDGALSDAPPPPPVPIPKIRVVALPVVPEGQLGSSRSYLLVASGCIGGPGVTDAAQQQVCGPSYSADSPTLSPILIALSRVVETGKVALGFVDGTPALSHCDVRLKPPLGADPITLAEDVVTGALRPRPPTTASAADDFGATSPSASIQVYSSGASNPAYDGKWAKTLDAGDLVSGLTNDAAYTLILLGPHPGFGAQRWWNDPLVTIVKN